VCIHTQLQTAVDEFSCWPWTVWRRLRSRREREREIERVRVRGREFKEAKRKSRKICENLLLRAGANAPSMSMSVSMSGEKLFACCCRLAHSQTMNVCVCSVCVVCVECVRECVRLTIIQKFYKQNERPLHGRRAETETTCKQFSSAIFRVFPSCR